MAVLLLLGFRDPNELEAGLAKRVGAAPPRLGATCENGAVTI